MKRRRIGKLSLSKQKLKTSHTSTNASAGSSSSAVLKLHPCLKPIALSTVIETQPQNVPLSIATTTTSTNTEETLHSKNLKETTDVDIQKIVQAMDMISYDMVALDEGKVVLEHDQLFPQSISIFCAHDDTENSANRSICLASNGLIDFSSIAL